MEKICGLGLELATYGLGLNDSRIRELGLEGRGLGLATMGLDYISGLRPGQKLWFHHYQQ